MQLDGREPTLPPPATPYETEALAFCRAWLSGQASFVLHTSGSTGTPKPITLTRAQMRASARLTGATFGLQPGDHALCCLNIRYVAGVMMLVRALELGLRLTIQEPTSNPLAAHAPAEPIDFAAFVPLQLQTMLDAGNAATLALLNGMKAILVGGAATSPALEQSLQVITAPVYATYGMTETVSHIAIRRLDGSGPDGLGAVDYFTALTGVTLGTDERGCLHITAAATNFERIQTNDVIQFLDEHRTRFRLLGRADTIINSGGVKIQPERVERLIETTLARFGNAPRLFVAGLPDERLGQRVVAFFESYAPTPDQWTTVQDAVRAQIGPYAVPKEYRLLPTFAETPTGKIDRKTSLAGFINPAAQPDS